MEKSKKKNIFIIHLNIGMLLTFLGVFLGSLGLYCTYFNYIKLSLIFLCFAGMCDAFDGTLAKHFHKSEEDKQFGVQLDSLSDIFVSGILPVCILLSMGFNHWWNFIIYFVFISCGILRLSYYNTYNFEFNKYFKGIPITASTIVFPVLYLFTKLEALYMICMLLLSVLFILNVSIKKPSFLFRVILSCIGALIILYVIFMKVNLG